MSEAPLLKIEDLSVQYMTDEDVVYAVNGLSAELYRGESLGFVGETGAGKTTTALSIIQLLPEPAGIITGGSIWFNGRNLIENKEKENQLMRGDGISMIFQDPMSALNPTLRISRQMMEVVESHRKCSRKEAEAICIDMLEKVGIKRDRFDDYPHQLSGGMKQRVVIAMALLCNPEVLIADEPTTALDVTIQAQILEIIKRLIKESNMSMMLITHDLGIVAETCDRIAVIYGGSVVESGTVREVYKNPRHPYTRGLFASIPKLDTEEEELHPIEGEPPNPARMPSGCAFHPRCRYCKDICRQEKPPVRGESHQVRCHFDIEEE
ncbi:MAG: ABC transporter ATP-binding protein [Clostridiales bacterium]|nr:ABC transporter ATP-binding protein [Clostridiales bacterium]